MLYVEKEEVPDLYLIPESNERKVKSNYLKVNVLLVSTHLLLL